jgi:hypothetical protein
MKKIFILLPFLLITIISNSQSSLLVNDKLPIDSLYENVNENLILSKVLEFEGFKKEELKTKVKNWGSTKFVNLKEVLVSETDDQIVLNYIDKSYFYKVGKMIVNNEWYVRLVIQFKDGKIRCQYFEDGNVFIPSQYGVPSTESRTFYFKQFFEEENGVLYSKKLTKLGLVSFKESIISNVNSLKESILKKDTSKEW